MKMQEFCRVMSLNPVKNKTTGNVEIFCNLAGMGCSFNVKLAQGVQVLVGDEGVANFDGIMQNIINFGRSVSVGIPKVLTSIEKGKK